MNGDANTDRNARNPMDVPHSELNAEIKQATQKLWDSCFHDSHEPSLVLTITRNARIQVLLSRQADEQTRRIVWLTRALVILTIVLLIFTVYLSYDAYYK